MALACHLNGPFIQPLSWMLALSMRTDPTVTQKTPGNSSLMSGPPTKIAWNIFVFREKKYKNIFRRNEKEDMLQHVI